MKIKLKINLIYIVTLLVLYSHMLRNVTNLYVLLLAMVYFVGLINVIYNLKKIKISHLSISIFGFILTSIWASLLTLIYYDIESFSNSTVRYFFTIPLLFLTFIYINNN